jgi:hypothetical protein
MGPKFLGWLLRSANLRSPGARVHRVFRALFEKALLGFRQIDPAEEAHFVFVIGDIFYLLPWMGLELLETVRAVAEFDLPMSRP